MKITNLIKGNILKVIASGLVLAFIIFLAWVNVPTNITFDDEKTFQKFYQLNYANSPEDFDQQIKTIRQIQKKVIEIAPLDSNPIDDFQSREPKDLERLRNGQCFDRSRSIEKLLTYQGFRVRHVYLLYKNGKNFSSAIFQYGQQSHAVTEVKTKKGWMIVDSNSHWIGLTKAGMVVSASNILKNLDELHFVPNHLLNPFWVLRGVYSRKGQLFPPYLFFPDINWADFIGSMAEDYFK